MQNNCNSKAFTFPIRVYYEDTDAGGVVYHAQYLNFFERCRTEWLRQLGYEQDVLRAEDNTLFVVSSLSIDYLQPALFNQQLNVTTEVTDLGASRLIMKQQILRDSDVGKIEILAFYLVTELVLLFFQRLKRKIKELFQTFYLVKTCLIFRMEHR